MLVLLQHVPRIQLCITVIVGDGEVIRNAEVNSGRVVTGCVLDRNQDPANEVEFPAVAVPDGANLLDGLGTDVRACLVLGEDEVRVVVFQIRTLAQPESIVFDIVFDTVLLPGDRRAWVAVSSFSVPRWIRPCIPVLALFKPAGERLSELFENALCSMSEAHRHHETASPSRTNLTANAGHCSVRGPLVRV